jgi:hypothetical protein
MHIEFSGSDSPHCRQFVSVLCPYSILDVLQRLAIACAIHMWIHEFSLMVFSDCSSIQSICLPPWITTLDNHSSLGRSLCSVIGDRLYHLVPRSATAVKSCFICVMRNAQGIYRESVAMMSFIDLTKIRGERLLSPFDRYRNWDGRWRHWDDLEAIDRLG